MNVVSHCSKNIVVKSLKKGLVMKIKLVIVMISFLFSIPAFAAKPTWAGKGKPTMEQKQEHKSAMQEKKEMDGDDVGDEIKDKAMQEKKHKKDKMKKEKKHKEEKMQQEKKDMMVEEGGDKKGLEKQKAKKAEQEQKELGKGSEKGQESRQKRKKWYKFWE